LLQTRSWKTPVEIQSARTLNSQCHIAKAYHHLGNKEYPYYQQGASGITEIKKWSKRDEFDSVPATRKRGVHWPSRRFLQSKGD
jgi:hypothetical protein